MGAEDHASLLHFPGRAERLDTLETHIFKAARLSRALWELTLNNDPTEDLRTWEALRQLASKVADHASAAEYLFDNEPLEKKLDDASDCSVT